MSRLIRRGEAGYEQARVGRIFNARRPDRFPAAILLADDADDVSAGVRLARERGWTVSVRSGGHSWAAWSLRDGALLIDLGSLAELSYDEPTGVLTAGPAARGGLDVAPFLAARGRAFPVGHCPAVGLGGYLLQGGQGWNGRRMGWACESVVAVDVVTADGALVRDDADLLWAARGAGPGFPGIVTAFHLQTCPAADQMWHDTRSYHPTARLVARDPARPGPPRRTGDRGDPAARGAAPRRRSASRPGAALAHDRDGPVRPVGGLRPRATRR
jgi:FAD/FMN-containing dehydrogenase